MKKFIDSDRIHSDVDLLVSNLNVNFLINNNIRNEDLSS